MREGKGSREVDKTWDSPSPAVSLQLYKATQYFENTILKY